MFHQHLSNQPLIVPPTKSAESIQGILDCLLKNCPENRLLPQQKEELCEKTFELLDDLREKFYYNNKNRSGGDSGCDMTDELAWALADIGVTFEKINYLGPDVWLTLYEEAVDVYREIQKQRQLFDTFSKYHHRSSSSVVPHNINIRNTFF